ncbi:hypothetical protein PUN28_004119 [Cardiocondyla obscurior]|uniref:Uncharacterized protein n=1 Tax=Cardiocondyla obscurior TaxID=286306 RepID=A0AAW2GPP2_9HYME
MKEQTRIKPSENQSPNIERSPTHEATAMFRKLRVSRSFPKRTFSHTVRRVEIRGELVTSREGCENRLESEGE